MNLKTSFFNKSIIKSDLKRMWWFAVLYVIADFLGFILPIINSIQNKTVIVYETETFLSTSGVTVFWAIFMPFILAVLLFSYINSSKSVAAVHGLPIKRKTLYLSHILSGVILFTIPIIVNALILILCRFTMPINYRLIHILFWVIMLLVYSLVSFTASILVTMMTGNSIAAIVLFPILATFPVASEGFLNFLLNETVYGYANHSLSISSFIYVEPTAFASPLFPIIKYLIFSGVFAFLGMLLYKIRKLEHCEEVIAFPKLRMVFVYGAAIYCGAWGFCYFNELFNISNILLFIPFGVVAIIAAQMLVKKSLNLKFSIKPAVFFCIFVILLQLGFKFDIFGYEKRVPSLDKIASVYVSDTTTDMNNGNFYAINDKLVTYNTKAEFTDAADIENVIAFHKNSIENRDLDSDSYFTILYKMKNGKTRTRAYHANFTEQKDVLEPILESQQMRKLYFPIMNDYQKEIISIKLYDDRKQSSISLYANDKDKIDQIISALSYDVSHTDYDEFTNRGKTVSSISIEYKRLGSQYQNGEPVPTTELPIIHETYYVRKDYERTKEILAKLGLYDNLLTAKDIDFVGINFYDMPESSTMEVDVDYKDRSFDKLIKEKSDIEEIYNFVTETSHTLNHARAEIVIIFKNGHEIYFDYDPESANIPNILK